MEPSIKEATNLSYAQQKREARHHGNLRSQHMYFCPTYGLRFRVLPVVYEP
jgi:hypothetical protein